jgi:hypothetical protein
MHFQLLPGIHRLPCFDPCRLCDAITDVHVPLAAARTPACAIPSPMYMFHLPRLAPRSWLAGSDGGPTPRKGGSAGGAVDCYGAVWALHLTSGHGGPLHVGSLVRLHNPLTGAQPMCGRWWRGRVATGGGGVHVGYSRDCL